MKKASTVDEYIAGFPKDIQELLQKVRACIRKSAPKSEETISYAIPTYRLSRNLVHFAAFKHHIGFYPGASGIAAFKKELSPYKAAKGSVQFPFDRPLPLGLIGRITKFRVKEDTQKAKVKQGNAKIRDILCAAV